MLHAVCSAWIRLITAWYILQQSFGSTVNYSTVQQSYCDFKSLPPGRSVCFAVLETTLCQSLSTVYSYVCSLFLPLVIDRGPVSLLTVHPRAVHTQARGHELPKVTEVGPSNECSRKRTEYEKREANIIPIHRRFFRPRFISSTNYRSYCSCGKFLRSRGTRPKKGCMVRAFTGRRPPPKPLSLPLLRIRCCNYSTSYVLLL